MCLSRKDKNHVEPELQFCKIRQIQIIIDRAVNDKSVFAGSFSNAIIYEVEFKVVCRFKTMSTYDLKVLLNILNILSITVSRNMWGLLLSILTDFR